MPADCFSAKQSYKYSILTKTCWHTISLALLGTLGTLRPQLSTFSLANVVLEFSKNWRLAAIWSHQSAKLPGPAISCGFSNAISTDLGLLLNASITARLWGFPGGTDKACLHGKEGEKGRGMEGREAHFSCMTALATPTSAWTLVEHAF